MGFRTPNYQNPSDSFPLALLSHILTTGESSRLAKRLSYEKQMALNIGGDYNELSIDPDLFYIYGLLQPDMKPALFEEALYRELHQIKTLGVTFKELEKAKNQVEAQFIMGKDSNFFQAMQLGRMETIGAGVQFFESYVENIRKVKKEDIQRVAQTYLVQDKRTVGILLPKKKTAQEKAK